MTAGSIPELNLAGYSSGIVIPAVGNISNEPFPGFTLEAIAQEVTSGELAMIVSGDIVSLISGLGFYIDGVEYLVGNEPIYSEPYTVWQKSAEPVVIVDGNSYLVEVK